MASSNTPTSNPHLLKWISECAALCKPDSIYWCSGSEEEKVSLYKEAVQKGILIPLNQTKLPGCYLHRSNPNDVARVEQLTFICAPTKEEAGPTNNWMEPADAYKKLGELFEGSMKGRTMYVVPYSMGPVGSRFSKVGLQLTDSLYVVLNMRIMTRIGQPVLDVLKNSDDFNRGLHSVRDCHPDRRFICHFPQDNTIWSVGSGYGGNALLGKKCLSLRIASHIGKVEGWLAEHMLVSGVESPDGQTVYVAAAFPSQCGKTNFAMLQPPRRFGDWKIWTVGDDLAWLRPGHDGRLWAINPENGYFGVAPGTSQASNPHAMATISKDTIYTNVALTADGDVWWEGKTSEPPAGEVLDWQGRPWQPRLPGANGTTVPNPEKAAHPNSRFTAPMINNPMMSRRVDDPDGVPISALIFGGRRATTVPLVLQSFNWTHGVFLASILGSETTAAAAGKIGVVRRDPFAMLPFCGYHMGSYFAHWLRMQSSIPHPPKIFSVNWFRKDPATGAWLWPGFGENMRVLKWIVDRALGRTGGQETLMGWVPREGDLDLSGLNLPHGQVDQCSKIDLSEWEAELKSAGEWYNFLGHGPGEVPESLELQRQILLAMISGSKPEANKLG